MASVGATIRRRVLAPDDLKALSMRSDLRGWLKVGLHLVAIGLGAAAVTAARGTFWMMPAMALLGVTLVTLFACVHETVHYTAFRNRRTNEVVGWIASTVTLMNSTYYRLFHQAHHRWCQDPARDPELRPPAPRTRLDYLVRMSGLLYWKNRVLINLRLARGDFEGMEYIPEHARREVMWSTRGMLVPYAAVAAASIATGSTAALWYWLVPMLMAQPLLRLFLLAEHTGCTEDDNPLTNTRTTLASWPVRFIMWNMPFHAEHHLYPSIPFHALPRAHGLIRDHLTVVSDGYLPAHGDIVRGLAG